MERVELKHHSKLHQNSVLGGLRQLFLRETAQSWVLHSTQAEFSLISGQDCRIGP